MRSATFFLASSLLLLNAGPVLNAGPAAADVLVHQPHDFNDYVVSTEEGYGGGQVGDDYVAHEHVRIESATFWMVAKWPVLPVEWSFDIYEHSTNSYYREGPAFIPSHTVIGPAEIIDLGQWNDEPDRHLIEITFENVNIDLPPDKWWISPEGWTTDQNLMLSYWGTANQGVRNWDEAWTKWEPFNWPGWAPLSYTEVIAPSDYAMRIEGRVIYPLELLRMRHHGIALGGNFDSLLEPDDDNLRLASLEHADAHQTALTILGESSLTEFDTIEVTLETSANTEGVDASVYLRDFNENTWVKVGEYEPSLEDESQTIVVDLDNPARFFRPGNVNAQEGAFHLRLASTYDAAHTYRVDHVYVESQPPLN